MSTPILGGREVAYREQALAKLVEARSYADAHPDAMSASEQKHFDGLMAEFKALDLKRQQAAGLAPAEATGLDDAWEHYTGPANGWSPMGGGPPPMPGRDGRRTGRSWGLGAGVVSSIAEHGIGFAAELATSGNVPVAVPIRIEPVADPRAAAFVADIIPEEEAPGGRFAYWKQTVRTNNAAAVARNARKPTSIFTGEKVSDEVTVIAHLSEPVNRFDLEDADMLRAFLTAELEYGLRVALDEEIINGDGVDPSMSGILDQAGAAPGGGAGLLAAARNGITALQEIDIAPTHFVLTPANWGAIELNADDPFADNGPATIVDRLQQRLFGLPVVLSNALATDTGIVGDFRGSAVLYRTGPVRVDWSENLYRTAAEMGDGAAGTDFMRNMIAFRAELRAQLAILRPAAFLSLDMTVGS